jgi:hypothetical protein
MKESGVIWEGGFGESQESKMSFIGFEEVFEGFVCFGDSQDSKMRFIGFEEGIRRIYSRDLRVC